MLMPKRVKHRKQMRGKRRGNTKGGATIAFGEYGLKATERGWITNRQIEAARVAMTRKIKRGGKRSEEHTSELQSRQYLVCRLLLEKKNLIKRSAKTSWTSFNS